MMKSMDSAQLAPTDIQSTRPRATLENLPREMMALILDNIPDALTLKALVHASPIYHSLYLHRRHLILSMALQNDMSPPCLVAACSVEKASWLPEGDPRAVDSARMPLICHYLAERSKCSFEGQLQNMSLETTISIFQRHLEVQDVAHQYAVEKLSINPVSERLAQKYDSPSSGERHRIYRALYNFQFYCHLFVTTRRAVGLYKGLRLGDDFHGYSLSQRYLPNLSVWEVEELACIREYLIDYYSRVWQDCMNKGARKELYERRTELIGSARIEDMIEDPDYEETFEEKMKEYWVSLGLGFFRHVCCAPGLDGQTEVLLDNPLAREFFLTKALRGECEGNISWCAAHPFEFDHGSLPGRRMRLGPWSDFPDFGLPNRGREYRRSWGYVFWDRRRIEAWKEDSSE